SSPAENRLVVMSADTPEIRVLGPLEVRGAGASVALGGPKQRAVLALLVARLGRVVATDEIIDGIWGDEPPAVVHSSPAHVRVQSAREYRPSHRPSREWLPPRNRSRKGRRLLFRELGRR